MLTRASLILLATTPLALAGWNPRLAAQYLDARQKQWAEWPAANLSGVSCISCHTSLPYLLARPALRSALGETGPSAYETGLLDDAQSGCAIEPATDRSFQRMWATQQRTGPAAALASLAAGTAPGDYQSRPAIAGNLSLLKTDLEGSLGSQPLHNGVLAGAARDAILCDVRTKQAPDGGWTLEALGPFKPHAAAPPSPGSNAYATAWVAKSHQDPQSGYWDASSMNKPYDAGSMQIQFMRDAATGFASAALAKALP